MKSDKYYIFCISIIKLLKKSSQFNKVIIIMEEIPMVVIRGPKTVYFSFDWPKDVDENWKQKIEL